jgi:membrane associated rhomboid family serine protease
MLLSFGSERMCSLERSSLPLQPAAPQAPPIECGVGVSFDLIAWYVRRANGIERRLDRSRWRMSLTPALVIFVLTIGLSLLAFTSRTVLEACVFRPYWLTRKHLYATIFTSGFVHADGMHLLFNMVTFYFFAFPLERHIGGTQFTLLYLLGLIVSHAQTWYVHRKNPEYSSLGASGAIAAVLFAAIVYFPEQSLIIFPIPLPIPAPLFGVCYLAYTWYAARQRQGRINHDAHLGGAITGLVYVAIAEPRAYVSLIERFT